MVYALRFARSYFIKFETHRFWLSRLPAWCRGRFNGLGMSTAIGSAHFVQRQRHF
jgi:hypothetical protein